MIRKVKAFLLKKIFKSAYKPGDYYSTIPDRQEILGRKEQIYASTTAHGIDMREQQQLDLLDSSVPLLKDFSFIDNESLKNRYSPNNNFFNRADAFSLFIILKTFKPKRIIEVGSGFSSALMMDINDSFFNSGINLTFVEPYPDRLLSLLKDNDRNAIHLKKNKVQDVPVSDFQILQENDILFIDSSHVSKVGSDLNYLLFNVIPLLNKGVIVHFHDIFYPFEYPFSWFELDIHWNENYILRAFLMFNHSFEIVLFNDFVSKQSISGEFGRKNFSHGASIYLKKKQ